MMALAKPLGELLIGRRLITERDLTQALAMQAEVGGRVGQALQRLGALTEDALLETLSEQLDLPVATIADLPEDVDAFASAAAELGLPADWFIGRRAVAWLSMTESPANGETAGAVDGVNVLSADPLDLDLRERLEAAAARLLSRNGTMTDAGDAPAYHLASNELVDRCLAQLERKLARDDDDDGADAARLREMAEEAPVIDFVNNVLATALKENASDVHIEAFEHNFAVRYRVDGVLHTRQTQSRARFDAIASRVKLIAGMDIAERRLPQDGRHTIRFAGNDIDLRVSSVPSTWGESIVMRLLRKQTELPDLEGLGLTGRAGQVMGELLKSPNGVLLVTGPTGSGKSTTLYRSLETITDGYRKIITIEDPVEYDIEGVTQIQVKPEIGYNFANGLRAILRQDPDVIMIGEIRDGETARIAVQAALTGHFVLSTLHTNSALTAVTRLEDIGLEPFLIGASVRGLMAQRLVRKVCRACAAPDDDPALEAHARELASAGAPIDVSAAPTWRRAVGCAACDDTGYRGRLAVVEIVKLDDPIREAIVDGVSMQKLFALAREQGFMTLYEDGLAKARAGLTTLAEVERICGPETE